MTNVVFAATSYPRSEDDWQSIFIRRMADALADSPTRHIRAWVPRGPLDPRIESLLTPGDARFLEQLGAEGGLAHLLRNYRTLGVRRGVELVARLHRGCWQNSQWADVYHLNWLQCALGLTTLRANMLVTVLGADLALLEAPGIRRVLQLALRRKRTILCPNAEWMVPVLRAALADDCEDVVYVPFGVDDTWFQVKRSPAAMPRIWMTVLRVTRAKIGGLFEWTRDLDARYDQLHLFGPMQEPVEIPPWIHYHGPVTPQALASEWYPRASALISLSQHDEGRPQVMLEAMAARVPVIASPLRAHLDLIAHERNGLICGTREEFVSALRSIGSPGTAAVLADTALETVRTRYGRWSDCAARYQAVYDRLTTTA
jgi:glycosyltransferase involved in cell wall biosynthesis